MKRSGNKARSALYGLLIMLMLVSLFPGSVLADDDEVEGLTTVITPAYRSQISGNTNIEFVCPGGTTAALYVQQQPADGNINSNGTRVAVGGIITLDANGHGSVTFPANDFPKGPITLRIRVWQNGADLDDAYLQLYNTGGVEWKTGLDHAPVNPVTAGMNLTFSDDFNTMPSISFSGEGTTYASVKPDTRAGGQFGYAAFEDYGGAYDPFSLVDNEYLKIATTYRGDSYTSPRAGWNQKATSGLISSMAMDGSGFHTQGGTDQYFEARIFAPPTPGLWPAFWTLTANNYADNPLGAGNYAVDELDAMEGYMAWPYQYSIAWHPWNGTNVTNPSAANGGGTWAQVDTSTFNYINLAMGFHIFGVYITEDTTYYYLDNVQVASHPTLQLSYDEGNYFIINDAISDHFINFNPDGTYTYDKNDPFGFFRYGNESNMYVDWVRVYERGNGGGGGDIAYVPGSSSTATATSETGGGWNEGPANAIDGNTNTKWASGTTQGLPQAITIDLGSTYNDVTQLRYFLSGYEWTARIMQHEIWVSTDNVNYTKVYDGSWPNVPGVWYEDNFNPVTARYVKLVATSAGQNASDSSSRASASEIQVGYLE